MKNRIFIATIISMLSFAIVSLIVFAALQVNTALPLSDPYKINVYYRSQTAKKSLNTADDAYTTILKAYNESFKKSYLAQITSGKYLDGGVNENLEASAWADSNKRDGMYLEFTFKENQRLVIYRDGNSRQIFMSSIIFKVSSEENVHNIDVYYAIEEKYIPEDKKAETYYPLTIEGDTRELYLTIRGILDESKK